MTRVSVITTFDHNIGDDFVREGLLFLLSRIVANMDVQLVHKHLPITARPGFTWLHSSGLDRNLDRIKPDLTLRVTKRIDSAMPVGLSGDRISSADILVQSGGPIYWTSPEGSCARTEWWEPLIERRWVPHSAGRPFLNLAGGTCQQYHSDASEFEKEPLVLAHIRRFYDLATLTTVRDSLSLEVLRKAGRTGVLLPCTSLFAMDRLGIKPRHGDYIVLNYMPTGGHFLLGQKLDPKAWEQLFVSLARRLQKDNRVILVCHNQKEFNAARSLLPGFEIFQSNDYKQYLELYSGARWGLLNRVHGCFALASFGKPSAVVGSDSRAKMVALLGMPEIFVNDATHEWMERTVDELEKSATSFPEKMRLLKSEAAAKYDALIRRALAEKPVAKAC